MGNNHSQRRDDGIEPICKGLPIAIVTYRAHVA
jgi:hypothetical protein